MYADSRFARPADVLGEVARMVHIVTGVPQDRVLLERLFAEDLEVDSLAMVEILAGLDRVLDVRIDDEAAKGFVRVADLVDHLTALLRRSPA